MTVKEAGVNVFDFPNIRVSGDILECPECRQTIITGFSNPWKDERHAGDINIERDPLPEKDDRNLGFNEFGFSNL